jgi:hypothetical protein
MLIEDHHMKTIQSAPAGKPSLPSTDAELEEAYQAYLEENQDDINTAREQGSAEDGAEWMMGQIRTWLKVRTGVKTANLDKWFEGPMGDKLFDAVYNGLT